MIVPTANGLTSAQGATEAGPPLSPSERRVIVLLAQGLQSKEMAQVMCRARPTIERYVRILHRKFGARSRAHLVALALARGCISFSDRPGS